MFWLCSCYRCLWCSCCSGRFPTVVRLLLSKNLAKQTSVAVCNPGTGRNKPLWAGRVSIRSLPREEGVTTRTEKYAFPYVLFLCFRRPYVLYRVFFNAPMYVLYRKPFGSRCRTFRVFDDSTSRSVCRLGAAGVGIIRRFSRSYVERLFIYFMFFACLGPRKCGKPSENSWPYQSFSMV